MAFSPDGRFLASTGDDLWLNVWDLERRTLAYRSRRSVWLSDALAYSPDGRWIATGDRSDLFIWRASDGELERHIDLDGVEYVRALAFAPDGKRVAMGGGRLYSNLKVLDVTSGEELAKTKVSTDVNCVAFSKDGEQLLAGDRDGPAVYDPSSLDVQWEGEQPDDVEQCWWGGNGIVTVDRRGVVRRFDPKVPEAEPKEVAASAQVERSAELANGSWLHVGQGAWIDRDGTEIRRLASKERRLKRVAVSADDKLVAHADQRTYAIGVEQLDLGRRWWPPGDDGATRPWTDVHWIGEEILAVDHRARVDRYRAADGTRLARLAPDPKPPAGYLGTFRPDQVLLSPDGQTAVFNESNILRWHSFGAPGATVHRDHVTRDGSGQKVSDWSWRGESLVTVSSAGDITLWTPPANRSLHSREMRDERGVFLTTVALGRDRIAVGTMDGELWLYDRQLKRRGQLDLGDEYGMVSRLAFSPDGRALAVARRGQVELWSLAGGRPRLLEGYRHYRPTDLTFSPDGSQIAVSRRRTPGIKRIDEPWVRVLDVATGKTRCQLEGHSSTVNAAAFSPDGKRLVTAGEDTTLLIWDLAQACR